MLDMAKTRPDWFSEVLPVNVTGAVGGRNDEALENMRGNEMVMPDVAAAIDIRLGRVEEARSLIADWLKIGPFSITTELCWAIKEPMKSANLDDLRKGGLPEK